MITRSCKKQNSPAAFEVPYTLACYCLGKRTVGRPEVMCSVCSLWYHQACLMDLTKAEIGELPFRVCYKFTCRRCSSFGREEWAPTSRIVTRHILVTTMANLTSSKIQSHRQAPIRHRAGTVFIPLDEIMHFMEENWNQLSRSKPHTHKELANMVNATLLKTPTLFLKNSNDNGSYALNIALVDVSPNHEAARQSYRPPSGDHFDVEAVPDAEEPPQKKAKKSRPPKRDPYSIACANHLERCEIPPCTLVNQIHYGLEPDPNAFLTDYNNQEYRVIIHPQVLLSLNDKDEDLKMSDDRLSVTGFEGHRIVRATHSVMKGTWYYEATVLTLPPQSCIRIGWSREEAPLGSALGFTKYTYSWRSDRGTKFHDAKGKSYQPGGYKEGDVLGILIHLPFDPSDPGIPSKYYLPPSRKNCHMVGNTFKSFKRFFDYEKSEAEDEFLEFPGSKIEFFLNGVSCGVAFENIYRGLYYPAVSLYSGDSPASVRFNFGPSLAYLPPGAQPMSLRTEELHVEQSLSDALFLVQSRLDGDVDQDTSY